MIDYLTVEQYYIISMLPTAAKISDMLMISLTCEEHAKGVGYNFKQVQFEIKNDDYVK